MFRRGTCHNVQHESARTVTLLQGMLLCTVICRLYKSGMERRRPRNSHAPPKVKHLMKSAKQTCTPNCQLHHCMNKCRQFAKLVEIIFIAQARPQVLPQRRKHELDEFTFEPSMSLMRSCTDLVFFGRTRTITRPMSGTLRSSFSTRHLPKNPVAPVMKMSL